MKNFITYFLCTILFPCATCAAVFEMADDTIRTVNMKEVSVKGSLSTQLGDKTKIFISNEMRRQTKSNAQMLGTLPNFHYDWATNSVTFNNSSNIVVLVDSVEKNINAVMNMQHIRFDYIEVVNKPTGQYQNYDVLIKFYTKPDYEGYDGNIFHNNGFMFNKATPHNFIFDNDFGQIAYTKNKLTLFGWYNFSMSHNEHNEWYEQYYKMNGLRNVIAFNPDGSKNMKLYLLFGDVTLSADYAFSKYRSLSMTYNYHAYKKDGTTNATIDRTYDDDRIPERLHQTQDIRRREGEHSIGVFYHDNSRRIKWATDANYRFLPSHDQIRTDETTGFSIDNNFRDRMDFMRLRLNGWTRAANDRLYLSAGYIGTWKAYSRHDFITNKELNTNSYLRNKVWATASYSFDNSTRFSVTAWSEHVHLKNGSEKDNQVPVGGNLMIFRRLKGANWIRFNYDCMVEYPNQTISTEYGYFSDSLTWNGGNPWLRSNVSHHFRLWFDAWNCFNTQAGCSLSPNRFCSITEAAYGQLPSGGTGVYARNTYQNTNYREWWLSVSFTKRFRRNFLYKADAKYIWASASYLGDRNKGNGLMFSTSLNYFWAQQHTNINVQYIYKRSLSIYPQSRSVFNTEYPAVNLQRTFFRDRLDVQLSYSLMFHLFNANNETFTDSPAYYVHSVDRIFDRQRDRLTLTLRYRFAGGKTVRQYNRDLSEEK